MKDKTEKENEREKQLELVRKSKELEIKRLRDQQQKQEDYRAKQDELKALNVQKERLAKEIQNEQVELLKRRKLNERIQFERGQQIDEIQKQKVFEQIQNEQSYLKMLQKQYDDNKV